MADLDKLNLRHLYYFWVIAREGAIVRAAEHLDLTPQTLSGQLAAFESALGNALFRRANRSLQLTDFGQTVFSYADDMFQTAQRREEWRQHVAAQGLTWKRRAIDLIGTGASLGVVPTPL